MKNNGFYWCMCITSLHHIPANSTHRDKKRKKKQATERQMYSSHFKWYSSTSFQGFSKLQKLLQRTIPLCCSTQSPKWAPGRELTSSWQSVPAGDASGNKAKGVKRLGGGVYQWEKRWENTQNTQPLPIKRQQVPEALTDEAGCLIKTWSQRFC